MSQFLEDWSKLKRCRIAEFAPFQIVGGQLWAPAYIKQRWRILELDLTTARQGAANVFALAGDGTNVVSLLSAVLRKEGRRAN